MFGYIGPNGAGKSTTIKIMCGILVPSSGTCIIDGKVPYKERKDYVKNIAESTLPNNRELLITEEDDLPYSLIRTIKNKKRLILFNS